MTNQPTRKRDALRVLAAVAAVLLAVSAGAGAVAAVPAPPHEVFGSVTDQNGDAVADVTVSVTDEDGNTVTSTTNADGYYEVKYPAEDGEDGETLTVSVQGESWTTSFDSGTSEEHDFQITVDDSTTSPPDDGGDDPATDPDDSDGDDAPSGGNGGQPSGGADEPTTTTTTTQPPTTGASGTAQVDTKGSATVDLTEGEGVESVSVSVPGGSGDVTVTELSAPPEGVSEPSGTSVAMVDISAPNPSEGSATVSISVRQSALPDGVSASELGITHYTDGAWQDLDTSVASSDGPIVLEAQVSSFSPFAVTAQDQATATTEPPTATEAPTETTGPTDTATTEPGGGGDDGPGTLLIGGIVVVLAAIASAGYLVYSRD